VRLLPSNSLVWVGSSRVEMVTRALILVFLLITILTTYTVYSYIQ
jgi:hypothetical protein